MAKAQTQAATSGAESLINQAKTQMPPIIQGLQNQQQTAVQRQTDLYNQVLPAYQQQLTTGGYDPTQLANLRGELQGMFPTGGYDPTQLSNIRNLYGQVGSELSGYLPSGGMDPNQLALLNQGYGGLAQTGGYTPEMQAQYLQQATSGNQALAANLASAAQRSAAASGGNAQAAIADIQRTAGQQLGPTVAGAELGLGQQITANRLAGLGGLAGVQGQLQQGRLGITGQQTGLGTAQAGLEGNVAAARQGIAGMQGTLESGVAQGAQRAAAGLEGLFNTQTGQVTALGNQILQGLGLQFSTQQDAVNALTQLSKNPGFFQTALGDIAQLGGAAGGVMSGLGGMGFKPFAPTNVGTA